MARAGTARTAVPSHVQGLTPDPAGADMAGAPGGAAPTQRLGVFEILFDWIREGRRIYVLGSGHNRYQLLAVEDLIEAILSAAERPGLSGEAINVGTKEFDTVREDLQALIDHAGSGSRLTPIPARPAELVLRALELLR